jgi:hypothetical protein
VNFKPTWDDACGIATGDLSMMVWGDLGVTAHPEYVRELSIDAATNGSYNLVDFVTPINFDNFLVIPQVRNGFNIYTK